MKQLLSTNTFLLLLNKTAEDIFNFTCCRRVKNRQLYRITKPLFIVVNDDQQDATIFGLFIYS